MSIEKVRTCFRELDTAVKAAGKNAANPAATAGVSPANRAGFNPAQEKGRYSSSFSGRMDVRRGWKEGEPC